MNCYFCQQPTSLYSDRNHTGRVKIGKCYHCKNRVRHVYNKDDEELFYICISCKLQGKNYSVQIIPSQNKCLITQMTISEDRCSILDNKIIIRLNFIPSITPDNIEEKLPTYILLS